MAWLISTRATKDQRQIESDLPLRHQDLPIARSLPRNPAQAVTADRFRTRHVVDGDRCWPGRMLEHAPLSSLARIYILRTTRNLASPLSIRA
jgi:hypothetical protein